MKERGYILMPRELCVARSTKMATTAMGPAVEGRVALAIVVAATTIARAAGATALRAECSAAAARRKLRLELASLRRRIIWLKVLMIGGRMLLLADLSLEQRHSLLHLGKLCRELLLRFVRTGGGVGHLSDDLSRLILQSLIRSEGTLEPVDDLLDEVGIVESKFRFLERDISCFAEFLVGLAEVCLEIRPGFVKRWLAIPFGDGLLEVASFVQQEVCFGDGLIRCDWLLGEVSVVQKSSTVLKIVSIGNLGLYTIVCRVCSRFSIICGEIRPYVICRWARILLTVPLRELLLRSGRDAR
jgi:hypothetical protein